MTVMSPKFDVLANENMHYKGNWLKLPFLQYFVRFSTFFKFGYDMPCVFDNFKDICQ